MEVSSDTKADGDGPAAVELPCWDSAEVDPDADFKGVTAVFGYGSLVRSPFLPRSTDGSSVVLHSTLSPCSHMGAHSTTTPTLLSSIAGAHATRSHLAANRHLPRWCRPCPHLVSASRLLFKIIVVRRSSNTSASGAMCAHPQSLSASTTQCIRDRGARSIAVPNGRCGSRRAMRSTLAPRRLAASEGGPAASGSTLSTTVAPAPRRGGSRRSCTAPTPTWPWPPPQEQQGQQGQARLTAAATVMATATTPTVGACPRPGRPSS